MLAGTPSKGVELVAQQPTGPEVTYRAHADEVAEAAAAADKIATLRSAGIAAGEIAILFRINAQSETFEDALTQRKIPYVVRGAARFFDRAEVRQAVTLLRGTARSGQAEGSIADLVAGHAVRDGLDDRAARHPRGDPQPLGVPAGAGRPGRASSSGSTRAPSLGDLVDDLDRRASEQHAPLADGVTLATLHTAKGLEWDAVFLCGMQDGTLPITYAETPAAIEEERRLLYVGVTRARKHLSISWALARNPGGRGSRKPSRFLDGVAEVERSAAVTTTTSRNRKARHCRECGGALATPAEKKIGRCSDCPASYDEALFERLREWRLARAADDSVPAFVVFTDATLQLIAEHRPATSAACSRSAEWGPPSWRSTATTCSPCWPAKKSEEIPIKSFAHYMGQRLLLLPSPVAHDDP